MHDYDMNLVAVEGGAGYIDTSVLKSYPDKTIRKNTAKYLMGKSYISAGEFFAVTQDEDIAVYGVENNDLYLENVKLFRQIHDNSNKNITILNDLAKRFEKKEADIYNQDLAQLVYKARLHRIGKLSLNIYWQFLSQIAEKHDFSIEKYENIESFVKLVEFEKQINFEKATEERKELISKLVDIFQGEQLKQLIVRTVEFEENKVSKPEYYRNLLKNS